MHILVAEDDKVSRELLRRMLESDPSHKVTLASDGQEAWGLLQDPQHAFDVCISDIQMPGFDGLELAAKIRADGRLAALPIVLCTAANDRATVQKAAGLTVAGYIVKPYTKARVLDKLQQIGSERASPAVPPPPALEDGSAVCQRLGIDEDTHRTLLHATLTDIREWIGQMRAASDSAERDKLLGRANGFKGACLSLGAIQAAQRLARIQSASDQGALDGLDQELGRISEILGVPAAA